MTENIFDGPLELLRVPGLGWTLALPVLPDGPRGEAELRVGTDWAVLAFGNHMSFRLERLDPDGVAVLRRLEWVELIEIDDGTLVARHRVAVRAV